MISLRPSIGACWGVAMLVPHRTCAVSSKPHNPKVAGFKSRHHLPRSEALLRRGLAGSGVVYRVLYRVEVGGRAEQRLEGAGGFGLHAGEHVLVGRHGEAGRRVPESFADDFD